MNNTFLDDLKATYKDKFFTDEDTKVLFPDRSNNAIRCALSHYVKNNSLTRYKRGLYSLADHAYMNGISKFNLANKQVEHSYISYESALSYHGLIPEAVYETTSAYINDKSKVFKNSMGVFSYKYSPVKPFYLDVNKDESNNAFIACALRALFDTVYRKRKLYNNCNELEQDLRIDLDELERILNDYKAGEILMLADLYNKKSTKQLAKVLVSEFK